MVRVYSGPTAWTYPAGLILVVLTVWSWLMFAAISRIAVPSCELLDRTAWLAASAAGPAAFLWPWSLIQERWLRLAASVVAAAVFAGLAWWATAMLFPVYC